MTQKPRSRTVLKLKAPVVQWIEQRSPKPQIPVRIWAGAPHGALALRFIVAADFGYAVYEGQDGFGTGAGFESFGGVEFVKESLGVVGVRGFGGFITEEAFDEGQGAEVGEAGCELEEETLGGGVRADAGAVIPAASFFEVAADMGVAVALMIGGEDCFEDEDMGAVFAEGVGGPLNAVAKVQGMAFALRGGDAAGSLGGAVAEVDGESG